MFKLQERHGLYFSQTYKISLNLRGNGKLMSREFPFSLNSRNQIATKQTENSNIFLNSRNLTASKNQRLGCSLDGCRGSGNRRGT